MERFNSLSEFLDFCWRLLLNGAVKRNDSLRTPVIGTFDGQKIHLRTVILRKTDRQNRTLLFFSDFRAAKVTHLQQNKQLSCVFYHPRRQFQIRLQGLAKLHHKDALAQTCWSGLPVMGRKNYASTLAPGSVTEHDANGIPDFWHDGIELPATEFAFDNFVVIAFEITEIECLSLHPKGHQRAWFVWQNDHWQSTWLIP